MADFTSKRRADGVAGPLAGVDTTYTFNVVGQIVTTDEQAPFFNTVSDVAISANHTVLTPTQTPSSGWTLAQIAAFFASHPAPLVNMNIPFVSVAAMIAGMILYTVRRTPDGKTMQSDLNLATLQSASDYQNTRVQVEANGKIVFDGVTYARLAWTAQNPAALMTVSWSFGKSLDLRDGVQEAAPVKI